IVLCAVGVGRRPGERASRGGLGLGDPAGCPDASHRRRADAGLRPGDHGAGRPARQGTLAADARRHAEQCGRAGILRTRRARRPNGKPAYPDESMESYLKRTTDGLPDDPWLRVHVRAGGTIVNVAPLSMHISGTLEQWREWTGLPFDTRGPIEVPDALVPVPCEPEHGYATYVEPNVWVLHRVGDQPRAGSAKGRRSVGD